MTKEEFVEKYKDYFRDDWAYPEIGEGWIPLISVLMSKIVYKIEDINQWNVGRLKNNVITQERFDEEKKFAEDFKITQIKEKFGGLRFYIEGNNKEVYSWISFAESMSYHMCEECGTTHNLGRTMGWIRIICGDCAEEIGKKDNWMSEEDYKAAMAKAMEEANNKNKDN